MKTAMQELIEILPSGQEIKNVISENDMDSKMLDEWLWERLFKGKDWVIKEKQQIDTAYELGMKAGYEAAISNVKPVL